MAKEGGGILTMQSMPLGPARAGIARPSVNQTFDFIVVFVYSTTKPRTQLDLTSSTSTGAAVLVTCMRLE